MDQTPPQPGHNPDDVRKGIENFFGRMGMNVHVVLPGEPGHDAEPEAPAETPPIDPPDPAPDA